MRAITKLAMGICLFLILGSVASDAQERRRANAGNATIYFMRPEGLIAATTATIKIAGRTVGDLRQGSYFAVSRPPGHYPLEVVGNIFSSSWESEIDLAPGQTYFLQVSTRETFGPGFQLLTRGLAGTSGRQLPGRGFNASYSFFALSPDQGRAELAKLRPAR